MYSKSVKTYIFCHDQNFILNSITNKRYKILDSHYYVFLGFNNVEKVRNIENVIISRELNDNIEVDKRCLQYCGWYSLYKNNLLDSDYIRLIDYDVDILKLNNETNFDVKSGMGLDFNFYFDYGFGESENFKNYIKNNYNITTNKLIENYSKKFNQKKWFSIGDVLIKVDIFKNFMEWFYKVYLLNKESKYFAHHFERYLTIYCLLNDIQYEIKNDEVIHRQLKSHNFYQ